ncbi:MAG: DUF3847 domain-containing protein [Clostridia bacterium]|nr:DUF3847 domain-containing protein [Clostridia bacterium]
MPHNPTLPELYAKRDKNQKYFAKLAQRQRALGDKIKADEKMMDSYTRRERTHRLCTRAGMLESFLRDPEVLSNDQVMALLRIAFQQEPVKEALKKMLQEAYSGKSPGTTEA